MNIKIRFIVTKYLHPFLEETLNKMNLDFQWDIQEYKNFGHLSAIAIDLGNSNIDGVIVSGAVAQTVINKTEPNLAIPVLSIEADLSGLYHMLLNMIYKDKNVDLNRVYMDFYCMVKSNFSCAQLLDRDEIYNAQIIKDEALNRMSLEELKACDESIGETIVSLWEKGEMDFVICFFSSIIPLMKKHNIPCTYVFPLPSQIKDILNEIISIITVNYLQSQQPATIAISSHSAKSEMESDWEIAVLQKLIMDYSKENLYDFLIKKSPSTLEVYTCRAVVEQITCNYSCCNLSNYLNTKKLKFKFDIGYGLGIDMLNARSNAVIAMRHGNINGGVFLLNKDESLIGPLDGEHIITCSTRDDASIREMAQKANLSELTIQRILHILKDRNTTVISARDFVNYFGGTLRNANRILKNMEESNLAVVASMQSSFNKGRPSKLYEIKVPD